MYEEHLACHLRSVACLNNRVLAAPPAVLALVSKMKYFLKLKGRVAK